MFEQQKQSFSEKQIKKLFLSPERYTENKNVMTKRNCIGATNAIILQ